MKKLLLVGLLALAGSVQAADWVLIKDIGKKGQKYIDKSSIVFNKHENTIKAWEKWDFEIDEESKKLN